MPPKCAKLWPQKNLLPCQKQNVKALSNLVGNAGKPILGNGKSIPDKLSPQFDCTSSMAQKRIAYSDNEVRYDFTKSCYVEGDLQLVVKVKINPDTAAPGPKECASRVSSSVSPTRAKQKHLYGLTSKKGPLVFH